MRQQFILRAEMEISGETHLEAAMRWMSSQHGGTETASTGPHLSKRESSQSILLERFRKTVVEMERPVPTAHKYADHPSFPVDLHSRLDMEICERPPEFRLRKRLSLINYVTGSPLSSTEHSYYVSESATFCYTCISQAANQVNVFVDSLAQ